MLVHHFIVFFPYSPQHMSILMDRMLLSGMVLGFIKWSSHNLSTQTLATGSMPCYSLQRIRVYTIAGHLTQSYHWNNHFANYCCYHSSDNLFVQRQGWTIVQPAIMLIQIVVARVIELRVCLLGFYHSSSILHRSYWKSTLPIKSPGWAFAASWRQTRPYRRRQSSCWTLSASVYRERDGISFTSWASPGKEPSVRAPFLRWCSMLC